MNFRGYFRPMSEQESDTKEAKIARALAVLITDVRLVLVAVVGIFASGFVAYAQVETVARNTASATTSTLDASVGALKARIEEHEKASSLTHSLISTEVLGLKAETAKTRAEVEGLRDDLRRLFPALPPRTQHDGGLP